MSKEKQEEKDRSTITLDVQVTINETLAKRRKPKKPTQNNTDMAIEA